MKMLQCLIAFILLVGTATSDIIYEYDGKYGYINGHPICGHQFWNNNFGAAGFCAKLGYTSGTMTQERKVYDSDKDSIMVGNCVSPAQFPNCPNGLAEGLTYCSKTAVSVRISCTPSAPDCTPDSTTSVPALCKCGDQNVRCAAGKYCFGGSCETEAAPFTWEQIGDDVRPPQNNFGYISFGSSVTINRDGSVIAVGMPSFDADSNVENYKQRTGGVQVFRKENSKWIQIGSDITIDKQKNVGHWIKISDDGSRVLVASCCAVYLFILDPSNETWTQTGRALDFYHGDLAMSGDGMAVVTSNPQYDYRKGRIYYYRWNLGTSDWEEKWRGGGFLGVEKWFGETLGISGDGNTFVYNSNGRDHRVNIHKWENNKVKTLLHYGGPRLCGDDQFGRSFSFNEDGTILAVGGYKGSCTHGFFEVIKYDADSNKWNRMGQIVEGDQEGDRFGFYVRMSSDAKVISCAGTHADSNGLVDNGYINTYLYSDFTETWVKTNATIYGDREKAYLGNGREKYDMSKDGTFLIIGDPSYENEGRVELYSHVNKCRDGTNTCDINSLCSNHGNDFSCQCNDGYKGSGTTCDYIPNCVEDTTIALDGDCFCGTASGLCEQNLYCYHGECKNDPHPIRTVSTGYHCSNHQNLRVAGYWSGGSLTGCENLVRTLSSVCHGDKFHYAPFGGEYGCGCAKDNCISRTLDSNWNIYYKLENPKCDSFSCPSGQIHIDAASTTQCTGMKCTDSDNCCKDCAAGFVGDGTSCTECTSGETFAVVKECGTCTQCSKTGQEVKTNCITTTDASCQCSTGFAGDNFSCTQCVSGLTFTSEPDTLTCGQCNACDNIGQEIHTVCTTSADSICRCSIGFAGNEATCTGCQDGSTFTDAPNHTTCRQCSICKADDGQEIATACTTKSNTVCRCRVGFSGDGETCTACQSGQTFTDVENQSQCITCDLCAGAGQKIEEKCTTTSDAVCQCTTGHAGEGSTCTTCVSGETFTNLDDQDTCKTCNTCSGEGKEIGTHCTTTSDTKCRCVSGYAGNSDSCDVCVAGSTFSDIVGQTSCKNCDLCNGPGQEVATACSTTLNTVCRCIAGFAGDEDGCTVCDNKSTFTNISGELSCKRCNTCEEIGQEIKTQCTPTTDTVCRLVDCGSSIVDLDTNGVASCVGNTNFGGDQCTASCNSGYNGASVLYSCDREGDWVANTSLSCTVICVEDNTIALDGDCFCGTGPGICEQNQYCYNGECQNDPKLCDASFQTNVSDDCICGTETTVCNTDQFCYNEECNSDAYQACTESYVYPLQNDCVCGNEDELCAEHRWCYDGSCNTQARCKHREDPEKNIFYGAKLTGSWDSNSKKMSISLPVKWDINIEEIKWNNASDGNILSYSRTRPGYWVKTQTNPCEPHYDLTIDQNLFFGNGSRFSIKGNTMSTFLEVKAETVMAKRIHGYDYQYTRQITDSVPAKVDLIRQLTVRCHFKTVIPSPKKFVIVEIIYTGISNDYFESNKTKFVDALAQILERSSSTITVHEIETENRRRRTNVGIKVTYHVSYNTDAQRESILSKAGAIDFNKDLETETKAQGVTETFECGVLIKEPEPFGFVFTLEATNDYVNVSNPKVVIVMQVHTHSCVDHGKNDENYSHGVRIASGSDHIDTNTTTTFLWKMNATDDTQYLKTYQNNFCVETLTWTYQPSSYSDSAYDIALEFKVRGAEYTFKTIASIDIQKADVLADIGFGHKCFTYKDQACTEKQEKFNLGDFVYVKIELSDLVVETKSIECKLMDVVQKDGDSTEIKTNMKEKKVDTDEYLYNFHQGSTLNNAVICGAELESHHFHVSSEGYDTSLEIQIEVTYEEGVQKDIVRRFLSIPILNSMNDEVKLSTPQRDADQKVVSTEIWITDEVESNVSGENNLVPESMSHLRILIICICAFTLMVLTYSSYPANKVGEYVPLMETEMEL